MRLLVLAAALVAGVVWGTGAEAGQQQRPAEPPPPAPPMTLAAAGISVDFPTPPMTYTTKYFDWEYTDREAELAGEQRMAAVHVLVRNNIIYRASVVNFSDKPEQAATIWGECVYLNEETGQEDSNVSAPVGQGVNTVYGRIQKITLREMQGTIHVGCFFHKGHLYKVEAYVLPARGMPDAPEALAFVRSIRFLN
jgi:hypothetical protein